MGSDFPGCYEPLSVRGKKKSPKRQFAPRGTTDLLWPEPAVVLPLHSHNALGSTGLMFLGSVCVCSPPLDTLIKVSAEAFPSASLKISFRRKIPSLVNLFQQNGLAKQWKLGTAKCLLFYSWKADCFVEGSGGGKREPELILEFV